VCMYDYCKMEDMSAFQRGHLAGAFFKEGI